MIDKFQHLCSGCGLCVNVCPTNAIKLFPDKEDPFSLRPVVDSTACLSCSKCIRLCPFVRKPPADAFRPVLSCMAGLASETTDYIGASSGGIGSALLRFAVENGYSVFSSFYKAGELSINEVTEPKHLALCKGSKYVYSNPKDIYRVIKKVLATKPVLFLGTPCQVYALKTVISSDALCENLLTVDLVCHGTPLPGLLNMHLAEKAKLVDKDIQGLSFRDGSSWRLRVFTEKGIVYSAPSFSDRYFAAFLKGLSFQNGCYSCPFAQQSRCSDITLGDFWGLPDEHPIKRFSKGRPVSVVLVHSDKGGDYLRKMGGRLMLVPADFNVAVQENHQLNEPSTCDRNDREIISTNLLKGKSFGKSIKGTKLSKTLRRRVIRSILLKPIKVLLRRKKK